MIDVETARVPTIREEIDKAFLTTVRVLANNLATAMGLKAAGMPAADAQAALKAADDAVITGFETAAGLPSEDEAIG